MLTKRRIILVDDEPLALGELKAMLTARHLDFEISAAVESTVKAWEIIQANQNIEGIFLDIDIQSESKRAGLDFALNLARLPVKPWIIFVTGYREYAIEAYQAFPACYLVKPLDDGSLEKALNWVRHNRPAPLKNYKRLSIRHRLIDRQGERVFCTDYVYPEEILYIQKNPDVGSVKIGLNNGEVLDGVISTLKEWEDLGFFKIHRRNLVNLKHVRREKPRYGENNVYKISFQNGLVELDIGPDYYVELKRKLQNLD